MSVRLADVPNATQVLVRYGHTPYALTTNLANEISLGSGSGTIPWDHKLGTLYYKLLYLNSSGAVLASSDVQSL